MSNLAIEIGSGFEVADEESWTTGKGRFGAWLRVGLGVGFLASLILASFVAPLPWNPGTPDPNAILAAPSSAHWFGTDQAGLDVFSRTIAAAHTDLLIGVGGALIGMVVGSVLGLAASTKSRLSELFMRFVDVFQSFPLLVLLLAIVAFTGGGDAVIVATVAIVSIPPFIRLIRAEALSIRESKYVEFAEVIGLPTGRLMGRHVLRNVTGVILVQASLAAAAGVGVIAALSYLGEGVTPPTPSWGSMIQSGSSAIGTGQWWPVIFPAAALVCSIIALNVVADAISGVLAREQG